MSQKVDITSKRITATGSVSGGPARLRQLQVKSGGSGNPRIILLDVYRMYVTVREGNI